MLISVCNKIDPAKRYLVKTLIVRDYLVLQPNDFIFRYFESIPAGLKGEYLQRVNEIADTQIPDTFFNELCVITSYSIHYTKLYDVVRPKDKADLIEVVRFCGLNRIPLTMRAGGTSLAGQAVGAGVVMDVSKYMNRVLEINVDERWVKVEPGVILSDLNKQLAPLGLMFGPETSTANRCCIGGMIGNNSCGLHSLVRITSYNVCYTKLLRFHTVVAIFYCNITGIGLNPSEYFSNLLFCCITICRNGVGKFFYGSIVINAQRRNEFVA